MKSYLVKVYEMNEKIEKELMKIGEVEKVSTIFRLYLVRTVKHNENKIKNIEGVISVKEESTAQLMPLIASN